MFARLTAALLIVIVTLLPAAARANQSFNAGQRAPHSFSFRKSFGSPPDPVVVTPDLSPTPLATRIAPTAVPQPRRAADEAVPLAPAAVPPDALRAPPADSLR